MSQPFEITWRGPGLGDHRVAIKKPGRKERWIRETRLKYGAMDLNLVELIAPAEPGDYELVYWDHHNRTTLATRTIAVAGMEVSLAAPAEVKSKERFYITWRGPGLGDHRVAIKPTGREAPWISETRLKYGDMERREVELTAPAEPGSYELVYWDHVNRETLAVRAVVVR